MATEKPNLHENFMLRGESFKDGMLLLIKHLNEQDWKLGNQFSARSNLLSKKIETHYKKFKDDLENEKVFSFEAINSHFDNLIASYISILNNHTTLKNPLQSLRDAECCAVWKKGREHFDTQFLVDNSNARNLEPLKIVLSETPYTDSDILQPEYTVLTTWFKSLPKWQQDFIRENREELFKKSIPSSFRGVAGLANVSHHECKLNDVPVLSYFRHATQLPIDLLGQKGTEDEQFRLTCLNIASQIRLSLDEKLRHSASSSQEELVILSQSIVSPGVIANVKAKFISVASDNDTKIYELKEQAIQLFQHALANPEAKIDDDKIKRIFFLEEENQKDLFYKDFLKKWRLNVPHNTYQYKPVKLTLVSTNHPLNTLRHFEAYQPQIKNNEKNTALLLDAVARHLKLLMMAKPKFDENDSWPQFENYLNQYNIIAELNNKLENLIKILELREKDKISVNRKAINKLIKELLVSDIKVYLDENTLKLMQALYALLSIPKGQGVLASDERHKPLLRSTAEIMVINCLNGAAWIACKSGKDRTGGASIAVDAMAIYYEQNKKFPLFHDNQFNREDYLKITQKLYKSGHHQYQASENAPGAKGLIKPTCFFPGDLKLDASIVLLETELARLNKPKVYPSKNQRFNRRVLKSDFIDDLLEIKDKTIIGALGTNVTLQDWQRNWESYNINGRSVKELRNNENFKDEQDLSTFIEIQLLAQVKNQQLKEYYKALVLYSFHQGGFPHAFSKVSMASVNQYLAEENAIIAQPNVQINFSWSEARKGIQIEEINTYEEIKTYKEKKDMDTATILRLDGGKYYCQTQSCILLNLNEAKAGAYKLAVNIQSASVDCVDELKPLFFKKSNLLEIFIQYLQSLLVAIKQYCDELIKKPSPVMNENWLSKTKLSFFKKTTAASEDENESPSSTTKPVLSSICNQ